MTHRVEALTGLRFVAAIFVLLAHAYPAVQFQANHAIVYALHGLAGTGMVLFFTLSGYVISANYSAQFRTRPWRKATWNFAVARVARLYPAYAAVFVLALLLAAEKAEIDWPNLPFFIPMSQAWLPTANGRFPIYALPGYAHSWSLSVELALYAVFPLAVLATRFVRTRGAFLLVCLAVVTLGAAANLQLSSVCGGWQVALGADACDWLIYRSPITHFFEFFAGMCTASAIGYLAPQKPSVFERRVGMLVGLAAIAIGGFATYLMALSAVERNVLLQGWSQSLLLLAVPLLLFVVARYDGRMRTFMETRFMIWGGEISYSLYLLHPIIIEAFVKPPRLGISVLDFLYWLTIMAAIFATCLLAASASYQIVEMPGRRLLRRLMRE
ncbi:acyltransferase [Aureimonas sp. SA4125]|uniref:acyltransferase family protein n=1 Tax=Aureimonas sp. SA4125 TaxID=2826993 RepID=UPI001CC4487D|nr:acyltransferase [Aureimonas sp. SA4125]BDA83959.1 acyltransferase [Aureimonas sp. SA4125]